MIMGVLLIGMSSCKKDENDNSLPVEIPSQYEFTGISTNNQLYGYRKTNGQLIAIASSDIPTSTFSNTNQVQRLDDISFTSNTSVSYTAYNEYDNNTRTETVSFEVSGNNIVFDWMDEFGNPYGILTRVSGNELRVGMYAYVTIDNTFGSQFEAYLLSGSLNTIQSVGEDDILNRANGLDEGEEIYLMSYEQIHSKL